MSSIVLQYEIILRYGSALPDSSSDSDPDSGNFSSDSELNSSSSSISSSSNEGCESHPRTSPTQNDDDDVIFEGIRIPNYGVIPAQDLKVMNSGSVSYPVSRTERLQNDKSMVKSRNVRSPTRSSHLVSHTKRNHNFRFGVNSRDVKPPRRSSHLVSDTGRRQGSRSGANSTNIRPPRTSSHRVSHTKRRERFRSASDARDIKPQRISMSPECSQYRYYPAARSSRSLKNFTDRCLEQMESRNIPNPHCAISTSTVLSQANSTDVRSPISSHLVSHTERPADFTSEANSSDVKPPRSMLPMNSQYRDYSEGPSSSSLNNLTDRCLVEIKSEHTPLPHCAISTSTVLSQAISTDVRSPISSHLVSHTVRPRDFTSEADSSDVKPPRSMFPKNIQYRDYSEGPSSSSLNNLTDRRLEEMKSEHTPLPHSTTSTSSAASPARAYLNHLDLKYSNLKEYASTRMEEYNRAVSRATENPEPRSISEDVKPVVIKKEQ